MQRRNVGLRESPQHTLGRGRWLLRRRWNALPGLQCGSWARPPAASPQHPRRFPPRFPQGPRANLPIHKGKITMTGLFGIQGDEAGSDIFSLSKPCCKNCDHWRPVTHSATVGECEHPDNAYFVEASGNYVGPVTVDLGLCTRFEKHGAPNMECLTREAEERAQS